MSFKAKYEGSCCHQPINPGDEIETYSSGRYEKYRHVQCPISDEVRANRIAAGLDPDTAYR